MVGAQVHLEECPRSGMQLLSATLHIDHADHPYTQADPSLVWGHEKTEWLDNQGWQWRSWFKECGKAFKIKAAWGHPDIVSLLPRLSEMPHAEQSCLARRW